MGKEAFAGKVSSAAELAKSNISNEAKRLEEKIKTYNSTIKKENNGSLSSLPKTNALTSNSTSSGNSSMKQKLQNKAGSAALQSLGLPKEAADGIMNFAQTEQGKKLIKNINKTQFGPVGGALMNKLFDKATNSKKEEGPSEVGMENFGISKKAVKWLAIASTPVFTILIFCCLFISASQVFLNSISLGTADSLSGKDVEEKINKKGTSGLDDEKSDSDVAFDIYIDDDSAAILRNSKLNNKNISQIALTKYLRRKYNEARLEDIEDFYPAVKDLSKNYDENMVYDFYFKMYNVYKAYRDNYNVYLDLPLMMATLNLQSADKNVIFSSNLTQEDRKSTIRDSHTEYDYYYDWSSYKVTKENSEHDIELIAQHMVSVRTNIDEKPCENELKDGKCYEINNDQYKEFLKEFLEKKYYVDGGGTIASNVGSTDSPIVSPEAGNSANKTISSMAEKMVEIANQEYVINAGATGGYKYVSAFGAGVGTPWCAIFAWYVSSQTEFNGQKLYPDIISFKSASTGHYMQLFDKSQNPNIKFYYNDSCSKLSGKNGNIKYTPKPGDYVFIDWAAAFTNINQSGPGWGPQDHTGLVEKYENGKIYTIEGNNGNTIRKLSYSANDCRVIGFGSWY